jgi:hypothetical protein
MAGSSTKQAWAPRWSALQRWTLGVTSMAAFMAGMDALVVTTPCRPFMPTSGPPPRP